MRPFAHYVFRFDLECSPLELEAKLDENGSQGWELVSIDWARGWIVMRRPK